MNARLTDHLAIAVAQLNPTVGDIAGNADKARRARAEAARQGADLLVLSELFIAGYPPENLVLKPAFQDACRTAGGGPGRGTRRTADRSVVVGSPCPARGKCYNAVSAPGRRPHRGPPLQGRASRTTACSTRLRVFEVGPLPGPVGPFRGLRLGLPICEDIWFDACKVLLECLAETGA